MAFRSFRFVVRVQSTVLAAYQAVCPSTEASLQRQHQGDNNVADTRHDE